MPDHSEADTPQIQDRSYYLDNWKSSLTALVIYHHTASSYGGLGATIYYSRLHKQGSSPVLVGFNAINQAHFMGSFFFLSGYFSRKSLQKKKSIKPFIQDRLCRLGIPSLIYTLLGRPCCTALAQVASGSVPELSLFTQHLKTLRGVSGPVWFTTLLLVFDVVHAWYYTSNKDDEATRRSLKMKKPKALTSLGHGEVICLDIFLSFAIRLFSPIGKVSMPLNLRVGYLPQYVITYLYGASIDTITDAIPSATLFKSYLAVSLLSSAVMAKAAVTDEKALIKFEGGWNAPAFLYAVWNEIVGYFIGTSMLAAFRAYGNVSLGSVGKYAFNAYLVHMPVSVFIETCMDCWKASGVIKTLVIGTLNVVGVGVSDIACLKLAGFCLVV